MTKKKYRVHDWVKFNYSEIGEYIDENHTDRPLRNDEVVKLLNELHEENQDLKSFNKDLAENLSACANARISKDNLIEKLTEENERLKKHIEEHSIDEKLLDDLYFNQVGGI